MRYAVLFKYEDGTTGLSGYYKNKGTAIRKAKENNACKWLHYAGTYFVKDMENNKIIEEA